MKNENRTVQLVIKVTREEKLRFREKAFIKRMTLSEFAREAMEKAGRRAGKG